MTAAPEVVVAIGPFTNLHRWWAPRMPPVPVVAMGGALAPVTHRGEERTVETNVGLDPEAASWLFGSGGAVTLVPLDVTAAMVVSADEQARLSAVVPGLRAALDGWPHALCLHDPLAVLVALGDVAATKTARRLSVSPDGIVSDGDGFPSVTVVIDADIEGARTRAVEVSTAPM